MLCCGKPTWGYNRKKTQVEVGELRPRKKDKHLPKSVYFKHGRYYHVIKGKWNPLSTDLAEALSEYARRITPGGGISKLVDDTLVNCSVKDSTLEQYKKAGGRIKEAFQEFQPNQITRGVIKEFLEHHKNTPFMANRLRTVLKLVLDRALDMEQIPFNPVKDVKPFPEPPRERYLEDWEYVAIRDNATPAHIPLMMDLAYLTGQRVMDIIKLKESSIRGKGIHFSQMKTNQKMAIEINDALEATIQAARALNRVRGLTLFHQGNGKEFGYGGVRDGFKRACIKAGIEDVQLRDIRAKAATDAEEAGLNPTILLGHSDSNTTKRYLRKKRVIKTSALGSIGQNGQVKDS